MSISQGLAELGYAPVEFKDGKPLPTGLDLVIVYGPYGSLVPLTREILACRPEERPALVLIQIEQLPNPGMPDWLCAPAGRLRSWIERIAYKEVSPGRWQAMPGALALLGRGYRYRYYGDLFWLRDQGLLSVLAVWSSWTAEHLRQQGFDPLVLTGGRDPSMGCDLGLARDIPVLWIGKTGSDRRARLLKRLRKELARRGVELLVVDGVEHPTVFGEERTRLLNRTRIMVNLLREKWDDNSMRYALAAHNGALAVGEPTLPHSPFRPGEHVVEAPFERMAETIGYYLEHEDERRAIAQNAARLIDASTHPGRGMAPILKKAFQAPLTGSVPEAAV